MVGTQRVGVVMPVGLEYSVQLTEGAVTYAQEHPSLRLVEIPKLSSRRPALPRGKGELAGILAWPHETDQWLVDLWRGGMTVVSCGRDLLDQGVPSVSVGGSCRVAAEYLADIGREHVACVCPNTIRYHAWAGVRGEFLRHVKQQGCEGSAFDLPDIPDPPSGPLKFRWDAREVPGLAEFLGELPKPAGIWGAYDHVADLVVRVALACGLRVPEDLAVLGLGDYLFARVADPSISTIPQPGRKVGYEAMELLGRLIDDGTPPGSQQHIYVASPPVIERESTRAAPRDSGLAQAWQLIQERACQGIRVADVVSTTTISHVTFNKRFRRAYGQTPGEAIRQAKVAKAKEWLATTHLAVTRIAGMCGFAEGSKFYDFFKRETGLSPSEYRRGRAEPGENE